MWRCSVEEHVGWQRNDRVHEIGLEDPPPNLAWARVRSTVEQGRAVQNDSRPASTFMHRAHLASQVSKEEHLAIGDGRESVPEPAVRHRLGFFLDRLLCRLPVHSVRRIRHAEVEGATSKPVIDQGVAKLDVGGVLTLGEHVRLADRVGLIVDLLPIEREPCFRIALQETLLGNREHPTRASSGIVDRAHDPRLQQGSVLFSEQEVHHEPDRITGSVVLAGLFIGGLSELAD